MLPILYDDHDVCIVNKPAGIPSVRSSRSTLASVADQFPQAIGSHHDSGVVHRLDNATSGCLIIAKTQLAYDHLRQQFKAASLYKEYIALVIGHPPIRGTIDTPIVHSGKSAKRMRCAQAGEAGQPAHTEWDVTHFYAPSPHAPVGYALLRIRITTGVRHQIRVHMAQMGHPLVGDTLYQSRTQRNCDPLQLPHHLLHAARIGFASPATGDRIECDAPLPDLFQRTLKTLDEILNRR